MKFFLFNSYWYNRVLKKLKNEGILGVLKSLISFLNKILNVKHTGEFPLKHFFVKKRRLIKKFTKENLDQLDDINIVNIGNYLLNKKLLNNSSIIYSFGVGENLNFEKKVSDLYDCKVYCFDPTSLAINFIKNEKFNKNNIFFEPYGIWIEDGKVKFYEQEINQDGNTSSITNLFETENYTLLDCYKLHVNEKNNHSKIDVIKLDIEGAH